jgi:hypothetical protein
MLAVRPRNETLGVALPTSASTLALAASTRAWIAAPLFGLLLILRFALQPPADRSLSMRRRIMLALLGCSALACFVWSLGVRIAHWPG